MREHFRLSPAVHRVSENKQKKVIELESYHADGIDENVLDLLHGAC